MSYDYKEVVQRVNGLSSVSTLKKWRKKAEDLAGISFQEGLVGVREQYAHRVPLFSQVDLAKFQQVANTKGELGLNNAILRAFIKEREPPKSINERVELLELVIMKLDEEAREKANHIYQENQSLNSLVSTLEKRITQLEEQSKRKGWFR